MNNSNLIDLESENHTILGPFFGSTKLKSSHFDDFPKNSKQPENQVDQIDDSSSSDSSVEENIKMPENLSIYITFYENILKKYDASNFPITKFFALHEDLKILTSFYHGEKLRLVGRNRKSCNRRFNTYLKKIDEQAHKEIQRYLTDNGLKENTRIIMQNKQIEIFEDFGQNNNPKQKNTLDRFLVPKGKPNLIKAEIEDVESISDNSNENSRIYFNDEEPERYLKKIKKNNMENSEEEESKSHKSDECLDFSLPTKKIKKEEISRSVTPSKKKSICCEIFENLKNIKNTDLSITNEDKDIQNDDYVEYLKKNERFKIVRDLENETRMCIKEELSEFYKFLLTLTKSFKKDLKTIILDLERVSGNIKDLIEYYEEDKTFILWEDVEDEQLINCENRDDKELLMLIKYKGIESVKNRINFKKLNKKFNL